MKNNKKEIASLVRNHQWSQIPFSNSQLTTRKWITRIGIVAICIIPFLATPKIPFLTTALIGAFILTALLYSHHAAMSVQWPSARKRMRWIRNTRRFFAATPFVRFLYSLAFLVSSTSMLLMFMTNWGEFSSIGGFASMLCSAIAFPIDVHSRFAWLLRYPWIKKTAYTLFGYSAAATLFIAHILGKKIAEGISGVDAKYLPDFVQITGVIAYPIALLLLISAITALILTIETITVYVLILCTQLKQFLFGFLNYPARNRIENSFHRFATGKKLRSKPPFWFRMMDNFHLFFRIISPMAFIALFSIILFGSYGFIKSIDKNDELLRKALVLIEYKVNTECTNLSSSDLILKLDGNLISTASTSADSRTVFNTITCEKKRPS